jgi:hypothetical protein
MKLNQLFITILLYLYNYFVVFPISKTKPSLHMVAAGGVLRLHINVEGSPLPAIQWLRNGYKVDDETSNTLIVQNVNKADHEGTYTCELSNMLGTYTWLESTVIVKESESHSVDGYEPAL